MSTHPQSPPARKLRIAWSVACGIACLLFVALWVRSHWWCDVLSYREGQTYVSVGCGPGIAWFRATEFQPSLRVMTKLGWRLGSGPAANCADLKPLSWTRTSDAHTAISDLRVTVPCWCCATFFATLAVAPWLPWRFSLRALLIAMTLLAVLLGAIVISMR
jgi:hypothetical protein